MNPRQAFLDQVRTALAQGNQPGSIPPLPKRGRVGYQGSGLDPVQRFCTELTAAGGKPHVAADRESAWRIIAEVVRASSARKILLSHGGLVEQLGLAERLRSASCEITVANTLTPSTSRDRFFAADLSITNVHKLIAETGTIVMATSPTEPRSLSLLPPIHIALADRSQLLPDLFDLFDLFNPLSQNPPPACLSLITGPSKTGDIELRLVTGVHGPGEVHVIVCL